MKKDNNIAQELKELAPFLASLEKKNAFGAPVGYFEQNEEILLEAVRTEEKVKSLRKISSVEVQQGIPTDYFETLPSRILGRIKNGHEEKVIPIIRGLGLKQWLQIAAAVVAVVVAGLPMPRQSNIKHPDIDVALQKVSDAELDTYVNDNAVILNEDDLAAHISNAKLEQATTNIISQEIDLDENDIDVSDIDLNDIENL